MFERFTEKARRVIFFSRYEATQYGSTHIDTEHLLLGLIREHREVVEQFLPSVAADIRTEIVKSIPQRSRISASVEVPLTTDAKEVLNRAIEESERLGHRQVGTQHLLAGMLMVPESAAARILNSRGVKLDAIRKAMGKAGGQEETVASSRSVAKQTLLNFLSAVKESPGADILFYFAKDARVVDAKGRQWQGISPIEGHATAIFTPYAKRGARWVLESEERGPSETFVASILWENITVEGQPAGLTHRMTVLLGPGQGGGWAIFLVQVTQVIIP